MPMVIDLRYERREFNSRYWYVDYLAYQASTPRNWIERQFEPLVHDPASHLRIIDVATPEQDGVADGYPTAGLLIWWTIIVLDGAPERMSHAINVCQYPIMAAHYALSPAEDQFRSLITMAFDHLPDDLLVQVHGHWRDGAIAGYRTREAATTMITRVSAVCAHLNERLGLSDCWPKQFHVRAGIGRSVRDAFSGLLHAKRDQLCCIVRETDSPVSAQTREMVSLLPSAA